MDLRQSTAMLSVLRHLVQSSGGELLAREVSEDTGYGRSTVCIVLNKLRASGFVESRGRQSILYKATWLGRRALEAEMEKRANFLKTAKRRRNRYDAREYPL